MWLREIAGWCGVVVNTSIRVECVTSLDECNLMAVLFMNSPRGYLQTHIMSGFQVTKILGRLRCNGVLETITSRERTANTLIF